MNQGCLTYESPLTDYCVACGSRENLTVDHIVPLSAGGSRDRDNLQTLCQRCNSVKWNLIVSNGMVRKPPPETYTRQHMTTSYGDVRTTVYLNPEQWRALKHLALVDVLTASKLVRVAVAEYLDRRGATP